MGTNYDENEALIARDVFVREMLKIMPAGPLSALVWVPKTIEAFAYAELERRLAEGMVAPNELSEMIKNVFSMKPLVKARHVNDLFKILEKSNYNFSIFELKRFLVAFGGSGKVGLDAMRLFLGHSDFRDEDLSDVYWKIKKSARISFCIQCEKCSPEMGAGLRTRMFEKK